MSRGLFERSYHIDEEFLKSAIEFDKFKLVDRTPFKETLKWARELYRYPYNHDSQDVSELLELEDNLEANMSSKGLELVKIVQEGMSFEGDKDPKSAAAQDRYFKTVDSLIEKIKANDATHHDDDPGYISHDHFLLARDNFDTTTHVIEAITLNRNQTINIGQSVTMANRLAGAMRYASTLHKQEHMNEDVFNHDASHLVGQIQIKAVDAYKKQEISKDELTDIVMNVYQFGLEDKKGEFEDLYQWGEDDAVLKSLHFEINKDGMTVSDTVKNYAFKNQNLAPVKMENALN